MDVAYRIMLLERAGARATSANACAAPTARLADFAVQKTEHPDQISLEYLEPSQEEKTP